MILRGKVKVEDLNTIKERSEILTDDEMIVATDNVMKKRNTTWIKYFEKFEQQDPMLEIIVIELYEVVNREATKKILDILKAEQDRG